MTSDAAGAPIAASFAKQGLMAHLGALVDLPPERAGIRSS